MREVNVLLVPLVEIKAHTGKCTELPDRRVPAITANTKQTEFCTAQSNEEIF